MIRNYFNKIALATTALAVALFGSGCSTTSPHMPIQRYGTDIGFKVSVIEDVTGDGKKDLIGSVASDEGGTPGIFLLRGLGNGEYEEPIQICNYGYKQLVVGDMNNDGNPDIIVSVASDEGGTPLTEIIYGLGNGKFKKPRTVMYVGTRNLKVSDVNGDNKLDILHMVANDEGGTPGMTVYFGDPNNEYSTSPPTTLASSNLETTINTTSIPSLSSITPAPANVVAYGDVNGDGKKDEIISIPDQGTYLKTEGGMKRLFNQTYRHLAVLKNGNIVGSITDTLEDPGNLREHVKQGDAVYDPKGQSVPYLAGEKRLTFDEMIVAMNN